MGLRYVISNAQEEASPQVSRIRSAKSGPPAKIGKVAAPRSAQPGHTETGLSYLSLLLLQSARGPAGRCVPKVRRIQLGAVHAVSSLSDQGVAVARPGRACRVGRILRSDLRPRSYLPKRLTLTPTGVPHGSPVRRWARDFPSVTLSPMIALTKLQWVLIAALAGVYLIACLRVSRWARATGRRPVLWFLIALFCTALPAAVIQHIDAVRASGRRTTPKAGRADAASRENSSAPALCPHCGVRAEVGGPSANEPDRPPVCPNCGMLLEEGRLA